MLEEKLNKYAENLEFEMNKEEYKTLANEFEILFKQVDLIGNIEGIEEFEPLDFPFPLSNAYLREDIVKESLPREDALKNSNEVKDNCVSIPKVVE